MNWKNIIYEEIQSERDPTRIFSPITLPPNKRRIVILADYKMAHKLTEQIDWKKLLPSFFLKKFSMDLINPFGENETLKDYSKKIPPIFKIIIAEKQFRFPPQHPVNGMAYACLDLQPDYYFPLATFHEYIYQTKMNAFLEMCSQLGAKEVRISYAEENGIDVTTKIKSSNIPSPKGIVDSDLALSYSHDTKHDGNIFCSFPKINKIEEFKSPWLYSEPSWITLQKMRLERDVSKFTAEFNHNDEMGVTGKMAGGLNKIGIDIGGTYHTLTKRKFIFQVEFWPK